MRKAQVRALRGGMPQWPTCVADPRDAMLVEHWDRGDWSRLWWVRAELRWRGEAGRAADLAARLAQAYTQYQDQPFAHILVLQIVGVTGWAAGDQ